MEPSAEIEQLRERKEEIEKALQIAQTDVVRLEEEHAEPQEIERFQAKIVSLERSLDEVDRALDGLTRDESPAAAVFLQPLTPQSTSVHLDLSDQPPSVTLGGVIERIADAQAERYEKWHDVADAAKELARELVDRAAELAEKPGHSAPEPDPFRIVGAHPSPTQTEVHSSHDNPVPPAVTANAADHLTPLIISAALLAGVARKDRENVARPEDTPPKEVQTPALRETAATQAPAVEAPRRMFEERNQALERARQEAARQEAIQDQQEREHPKDERTR